MMGVVLVISGFIIFAGAVFRGIDEGPRFRHVFWAMTGFWTAVAGVFA